MILEDRLALCNSAEEIENTCLDFLIEDCPNDFTALKRLFDLYMNLERYVDAFQCAERLWELSPQENYKYGFKIADACLVSGIYETALEIFSKLGKLDVPDRKIELDSRSRFGLAQSNIGLKKFDIAEEMLKALISDYSDSYASYCALAVVYYENNDIKQSFEMLQKAIQIDPENNYARLLLKNIRGF